MTEYLTDPYSITCCTETTTRNVNKEEKKTPNVFESGALSCNILFITRLMPRFPLRSSLNTRCIRAIFAGSTNPHLVFYLIEMRKCISAHRCAHKPDKCLYGSRCYQWRADYDEQQNYENWNKLVDCKVVAPRKAIYDIFILASEHCSRTV